MLRALVSVGLRATGSRDSASRSEGVAMSTLYEEEKAISEKRGLGLDESAAVTSFTESIERLKVGLKYLSESLRLHYESRSKRATWPVDLGATDD